MHNLKEKLNNARYFTNTLNGIGVSSNRIKKEEIDYAYLDFEEYRQDLRIGYSAGYVKRNFEKVQRIIGKPDNNSKALFLSVKLKGKNADYITACNACNAFEMKVKRMLYGNKWYYMNTFVGSIEFDREHLGYHFHSIIILKEIKRIPLEGCKDKIVSILQELEETNSKNAGMVKIRSFIFSDKTRELGETIHYLTKTSSPKHDPLKRILLDRKNQKKFEYNENTTTINHFPQKENTTKRRTIENEGGRELKSFFLYG